VTSKTFSRIVMSSSSEAVRVISASESKCLAGAALGDQIVAWFDGQRHESSDRRHALVTATRSAHSS
jgi:hypothetical protein